MAQSKYEVKTASTIDEALQIASAHSFGLFIFDAVLPTVQAWTYVEAFASLFMRGGELQELLLSYARRLMRQVSQTAASNASHTAEERLSRWLLMCVDRVGGSELKLTQELMAEMLGTRRATVSLAAMVLQDDGLIHYSRGHITIIDRAGLKDFTCECYEATRQF